MVRKSRDKTALEADTVGYMPERFIAGYFELVRLGLKIDPSAQQFDNEASKPKKKYRTPDGGLRDEKALRFKAWVDRQLRAIGRDVQAYLNARDSKGPSPIGMSSKQRREIARELERKTELRCHRCDKYVSWQWAFCAWCGKDIHAEVQEQGNRSDGEQGGGEGQPQITAHSVHLTPWREGEDPTREDGGEARPDDPRTV